MENVEIKNITVTSVKRICRGLSEKKHYMKWNGVNLTIRYMLNIDQMSCLVDAILEACILPSGNVDLLRIGFIKRLYTIAFYTNIDIPEDEETQFSLVYGTDIYDVMVQHSSVIQLKDIDTCVDKIIGSE